MKICNLLCVFLIGILNTLVPLPTIAGDYYWRDYTGGLFNDPQNWTVGIVPSDTDNAFFSNPINSGPTSSSGTYSYTVTLAGSKNLDNLLILDDYVTFDGGTYNVNALELARIDQTTGRHFTYPGLTLTNDTTINASNIYVHGTFASLDPELNIVGPGSSLSSTGDLYTAWEGGNYVIAEVTGGASLSNNNAYLSARGGNTEILIGGSGTQWVNSGELIVGGYYNNISASDRGDYAFVLVNDYAYLESKTAIVGDHSTGEVELQDSDWNITRNGSGALRIGRGPDSDGSVLVHNFSTLTAADISVGIGENSTGSLSVFNGSYVTTNLGGITLGQSGGKGTLDVLWGSTVTAHSGVLIADTSGSTGTVNVRGHGATLIVEDIPSSTTTVTVGGGGAATLNISDGGKIQAPSVVNNGIINAFGADTQTIDGDVTNNTSGTIKITDTTFVITGTFTNNGAYISDPADNIFGELIINSDGYLVGGEGDRFIVEGDFTNNSIQSSLWNTNLATLIFDVAGVHDFTISSKDYGIDGISDNFNWGTMRLESGVSLNILDNDGTDAALYVGLLELADGYAQLSSINSAFNIYYDETLPGNAYLNGETVFLSGGAVLKPGAFPAAVPIPPAILLFTSGLLWLVSISSRRRYK